MSASFAQIKLARALMSLVAMRNRGQHLANLVIANLVIAKLAFAKLAFACCAAFGLSTSVVSADATPADLKARKGELAQLEATLKRINVEFKRTQQQLDVQSLELRDIEQRYAELLGTQRQLSQSSSELHTSLRRASANRTEVEAKVRSYREQLRDLVRAAYKSGRHDRLRLLLNQEDPGRASRLWHYHSRIAGQLAGAIELLEQGRQAYLAVQRRHEDALRQFDSAKSAEAEGLQALQQQREARANAVAALQAMNSQRGAEMQRLQLDRSRLETLVAKIGDALQRQGQDRQNRQQQVQRASAAAAQALARRAEREAARSGAAALASAEPPAAFSSRKGRLPWPVGGQVARAFGSRRSSEEPPLQGVHLSANAGQPVRAVAHGQVVFADWLRGFGLMAIVEHGDGYMSLYGHNSDLIVSPGDWVDGGDTIAHVGNSGGQRQDGLYFAIRHRGSPKDPRRWCSTKARF